MEDKIAIYKDENNAIQLEVRMDGDMLWLTRQQLALLFGRDYKTISKHINNALKEELAGEVVVAKFAKPHSMVLLRIKLKPMILNISTSKWSLLLAIELRVGVVCNSENGQTRSSRTISSKVMLLMSEFATNRLVNCVSW